MPHDFMPGLAGIPAAKSAISDVDGQRGVLEYRGIRVEELCLRSLLPRNLVSVVIWTPSHATAARAMERGHRPCHRRIKFKIVDLLKCLPEQGHPMDALQAAWSPLWACFIQVGMSRTSENNYWSAVRLVAKLPTIVAAWRVCGMGTSIFHRATISGLQKTSSYMLTGDGAGFLCGATFSMTAWSSMPSNNDESPQPSPAWSPHRRWPIPIRSWRPRSGP